MRRIRLVLLLVAPLAVARPAFADKEKAKELFKQGNAAYKLDHFDEAITAFEAAYREEPSAVFLFNIAQSHRLAKRPRQAAEFYKKYLKDAPEAKNRAQVEEQIAGCEADAKRLDEEEAARKAAEQAARERELRELKEREQLRIQQMVTQPPPPPPAEPKKKWPLWVGVSVGAAAVVAGAVTAGVLLGQPGEPSLGLENAR